MQTLNAQRGHPLVQPIRSFTSSHMRNQSLPLQNHGAFVHLSKLKFRIHRSNTGNRAASGVGSGMHSPAPQISSVRDMVSICLPIGIRKTNVLRHKYIVLGHPFPGVDVEKVSGLIKISNPRVKTPTIQVILLYQRMDNTDVGLVGLTLFCTSTLSDWAKGNAGDIGKTAGSAVHPRASPQGPHPHADHNRARGREGKTDQEGARWLQLQRPKGLEPTHI